jgi:hypothetical protein
MPALSPDEWNQAKAAYENTDEAVIDICARFNIGKGTLYKRRDREKWVARKEVGSKRHKQLIKKARSKAQRSDNIFVEDFLNAQASIRDASLLAMKTFLERVESGDMEIKDFKELSVAMATMKEACGISDQAQSVEVVHKLGISGLDLGLLSSGPAEEVDENPEIDI